jgi:hypothetical protein
MAKEYIVMKDGKELKTYKSLPAAKTLAEKEGAEVYADGECVYSPVSDPVEPVVESSDVPVIPSVEEDVSVEDKPQVEKYTLLHKMNVRKTPSLKAEKIGTKEKDTVVEAVLEGDWLHLTDGTFILYGGGKFAAKV